MSEGCKEKITLEARVEAKGELKVPMLEARTEAKGKKRKHKETPHWMDLALDDPLCAVSYITDVGRNIYVLHLTENNNMVLEGFRNVLFELVFPFYTCVSDIFEKRTTPKTDLTKLHTASREHPHVKYTCEFPFEKSCFLKMDEILKGLEDQLAMKDNLNKGLRMIIES